MRIACWIIRATDTHSEYVILIAFPLQQWLLQRISVLRLCVHCLCCLHVTTMWFTLKLVYVISFPCLQCTFRFAGKNTEPRPLKDLQIVATWLATARCSLLELLFCSFETFPKLDLSTSIEVPGKSISMSLPFWILYRQSVDAFCGGNGARYGFIVTILVVNIINRVIRYCYKNHK